MKKRIWELDAFRGLCILGMVLVHFVYDLAVMYRIVDWKLPAWFSFIQSWGNIFFFLISGTCVTLGSRSCKRGIIVFCAGMICTLVTWGLYKLGFFAHSMIIYFGVLHCLGICMLLWPLFKRLPRPVNLAVAVVIIAAGLYLRTGDFTQVKYLIPLGLTYPGFLTPDYFPLLPYLGYFLAGSALGGLLYQKKESLLPNANLKNPVIATLLFFGKHSLLIYLLHQPLLSGLCLLLGG